MDDDSKVGENQKKLRESEHGITWAREWRNRALEALDNWSNPIVQRSLCLTSRHK